MKTKLKKKLKLEKRTIRKLDVRSGLHGGGGPSASVVPDTYEICETLFCTEDCSPDGGGINGKRNGK